MPPASRFRRARIRTLEMSLFAMRSVAARLGRTRSLSPTERTGLQGEEAAMFHLMREGYTIVAQRWRTPWHDGEIDLVAWDGETLCFVEVKTRSGRGAVAPEFNIHRRKQRAMRQMSAFYVRKLLDQSSTANPIETRFDVVAVSLRAGEQPEIRLLKNYFS